jgi:hypothetical protein
VKKVIKVTGKNSHEGGRGGAVVSIGSESGYQAFGPLETLYSEEVNADTVRSARARGFWKKFAGEAVTAIGKKIDDVIRNVVNAGSFENAYARAFAREPSGYGGIANGDQGSNRYNSAAVLPEDQLYARILEGKEPLRLVNEQYLRDFFGVTDLDDNVYGACIDGVTYINETLFSDEYIAQYGLDGIGEALATALHEARHKGNHSEGITESETRTELHAYSGAVRISNYHPDPSVQFKAALAVRAFEKRYGPLDTIQDAGLAQAA